METLFIITVIVALIFLGRMFYQTNVIKGLKDNINQRYKEQDELQLKLSQLQDDNVDFIRKNSELERKIKGYETSGTVSKKLTEDFENISTDLQTGNLRFILPDGETVLRNNTVYVTVNKGKLAEAYIMKRANKANKKIKVFIQHKS